MLSGLRRERWVVRPRSFKQNMRLARATEPPSRWLGCGRRRVPRRTDRWADGRDGRSWRTGGKEGIGTRDV
jgi:hypothetical protein